LSAPRVGSGLLLFVFQRFSHSAFQSFSLSVSGRRVGHAAVQHVEHGGNEALLDLRELGVGQWRLVELSVDDALVEDRIDQLAERFPRDLFKRPRSGLQGVGERDERAFLELRFGAIVAIDAFGDGTAAAGGKGSCEPDRAIFGVAPLPADGGSRRLWRAGKSSG